MWNGTMFVDLDWPLNASSLLSASAELLVFITDIVFVMTWRGPVARPPRILGLEPHLAICLAQWTARSHAARNAVHYYRNHLLDGATLFSKIDSNKLRLNVKNEMTLICAKFDANLINISKVTSRKTKWPRFFGLPGSVVCNVSGIFLSGIWIIKYFG